MLLRSKRDITTKNKDLMFKNVRPLLKISLQTVGNVVFKSKKKKNTNKIKRKQVHKNNISNLVSNLEMIKRNSATFEENEIFKVINTKLFDLKTVSKLAKSIIEEKKQNNLVLLARNSLDSCNISIVNRNLGMQIASNLFIENITFSIILPEVYTHTKQINLKMKLKHEMNLKVNVTHSSKKVFITFDDTITTTNSNKNHNNNYNNNKQIQEQDGDDCTMREAFFCKELPLNLVWRKKGG